MRSSNPCRVFYKINFLLFNNTMSFIYTYNIPNLIYLEDILDKITNLNLNPYNMKYDIASNNLIILYEIELSYLQLINLNVFMNNYVPLLLKKPIFSISSIMQISNQPNSLDYSLTASVDYVKYQIVNNTTSAMLSIVACGSSRYQFRLYCLTNHIVLAESPILYNVISTLNEISISKQLLDRCVLELHVRILDKDGSLTIQSSKINFYN
jgi:hypothetical protein